jgi:hypothetical protein
LTTRKSIGLEQRPNYDLPATTIETNSIGIAELLKFYYWARRYTYRGVQLNISPCPMIDANLSALILAIAHKLQAENKVRVFVLLGDHMGVFVRNGLINHLAGKGNTNPYGDYRESAIALTTFSIEQDAEFCNYLRRDFFGHRGLDALQLSTKNILIDHFTEIFANVIQHANTRYPVFSCGQYYPEKRQLKFTLIDLGEGFLPKIQAQTGGQVSTDLNAIIWSTHGLNTTRDIDLYGPGGTGLKLLKNYCAGNNASFHICTGGGYVNFLKARTMEYTLDTPLPGSMVNLIFRDL